PPGPSVETDHSRDLARTARRRPGRAVGAAADAVVYFSLGGGGRLGAAAPFDRALLERAGRVVGVPDPCDWLRERRRRIGPGADSLVPAGPPPRAADRPRGAVPLVGRAGGE